MGKKHSLTREHKGKDRSRPGKKAGKGHSQAKEQEGRNMLEH
jgi:hypothetical protein